MNTSMQPWDQIKTSMLIFYRMFNNSKQNKTSLSVFNYLTLNLIETPFNAFANREDPDQAALVRAA